MPAAAKHDVFVYGTLRDPDLVRRLAGRAFAQRPAVLPDYRRVEPAGRYPWIEPCAGARVEGILLCDVDDAALARLDEYEDEGRLYTRAEVEVRLVDGSTRRCQTYVGRAVRRHP